jgi:hypothetical protein
MRCFRFLLAAVAMSILAATPAMAQISTLRITEAMSSSGNGGTPDWWEVTNYGSSSVGISGWKFDDSTFLFTSSVALNGVSSIAAGETVAFVETTTLDSGSAAAQVSAFRSFWVGSGTGTTPQIGYYSGSGISFSSGGDGLVLYDALGVETTPRVTFGAATAGSSFYYAYDASGNPTTSPNTNAILSTASLSNGQNTYTSSFNTGSPGTAMNAVPEPQTYVLLGIGAAFLLWRVRRRA